MNDKRVSTLWIAQPRCICILGAVRILAISNLFPPYVMGGNEIRLRQILDGLRERHEVHVLTSAPPDEVATGSEESWITRSLRQYVPYPRAIDGRRGLLPRELVVSAYNRRVAESTIRRFRPDVVYVSDLKRVFLGPVFAAEDRDLTVVWDITDTALCHYRHRPLARRLLPWMDPHRLSFRYSVTISDYIRRTLIERGVLDDRAVAIRQGVDLGRFSPRDWDACRNKPRRLLFVGSLIEDKGAHTVLEALHELVRDGTEYGVTICGTSGDEGYKARLRAYVRENSLEPYVDFRGRVPQEQLPEVYRHHDIYVFSSVWPEPFATTPLEAMACRVPVIGTPVGGQHGFFEDRSNALVYEPGDGRDLARAVRELEDDPLRLEVVERAFDQVHRDFDFGTYVGKIEDVLVEAAGVG